MDGWMDGWKEQQERGMDGWIKGETDEGENMFGRKAII